MSNLPETPEQEKDKGFTLVELLVVIVIIGILAAVAIPLFLSQRENAAEASVKSDLSNVALAMETVFVDTSSYPAVDAALPAGATESEGNTVKISRSAISGFCLDGTNADYTGILWHYDSANGGLGEGTCEEPVADEE